ncbi:tail fiber domain-containing protein [Azospirillum sp. A1-3]|uniref:tail fiber domain-containing protein n=1 Tax=Azospirillum sp. A1-3 TaxID=185874 RepID=UPI002076D784|nr:tail fiber domain-containing protein [Azospirillum sp. A1-3]MCM8734590.1 tail fiber domain-containing protein [Azospirillum sp. A1-3]
MSTTWTDVITGVSDVVGPAVDEATVGGERLGDLLPNASALTATATGGTTARTLAARAADAVNAKDFGATGGGVSDDLAALNAAAAAANGGPVRLPRGTYAVSAATAPAVWLLEDGVTVTGLSDVGGAPKVPDTSRLTGRIFHMVNRTHGLGFRLGDPDPWLERNIRPWTESIAEVAVLSSTGLIGLLTASRSSDDPTANMAAIGHASYGINDNTTNKEPAWAQYLEMRRSSGAGATYCAEMDAVNLGDTFDVGPYTLFSGTTGQTALLWLGNGGGDPALGGNTLSGAIILHTNVANVSATPKYRRGIIIQKGSLDPAINEALSVHADARVAWYDAAGLISFLHDYGQQQTHKSDTASDAAFQDFYRKRADGTTATGSLDRVHRARFWGYSGSADYQGASTQVIQRSAFSGGNARFSYDISAKAADGTDCQVTLNGVADKSFSPFPDATVSHGDASFRWTSGYYSGSVVVGSSTQNATLTATTLAQTQLSDSTGPTHTYSRKRADGTTATANFDRVYRANFNAYTGAADYGAGYVQVLQRSSFSGGNARFSYDIVAKNADGTDCQVTLNGIADKAFTPYPDNTISFGSSSARISQLYAGTATISTSDEREKQDIADIPDDVLNAWAEVEWKRFRFADAVAAKGEGARLHTGVIAQRVLEAFNRHGLDPFAHGVLCHDAWDDQYEPVLATRMVADGQGGEVEEAYDTGERRLVLAAGDRYGVRYEEAFAFEAALMRRSTERQEARIAALEAQLAAIQPPAQPE